MKIVQAVHSFPPSHGGIEHHSYHLSRELCEAGNEVIVITAWDRGTLKRENLSGIDVIRHYSVDFPVFSSARLPIGAFYSLLRQNADIYAAHGYGSIMPLFASLTALLKGKPFVFTLHGYPELSGKRSRILHKFYKIFIAPIFLGIAKKVIVVSEKEALKIEKEVKKDKIIYIPNGIEDEFNAKLDISGKNKITYVGRLTEDKGVDSLIRVFAKIKDKYPELVLKIVGKDAGAKKKLEELARSLNVYPIFSEVPYKKMHYIYSDSKVVVLPSRYEGFSLVWLDAAASGRAMFSTPVGEAVKFYEQIYDENAAFFLFNNEKELEDKLLLFLENPDKYEEIIRRAKYITKEEYSWKNVAYQTLNVYKEVI